MPTPDPAERRAVIRGAIECAIGLNPTVRPRQAAPLVASVWRIVEPALAQRDRQITAVRDVIDAMDGTTGARFWAQQLHAAIGTRPGATRPPIAWCGASMPGYGAEPIGPCVLRAGHDGPVHQAASGAKWWPTDAGPVPGVRPLVEIMQLDANSIDPAATHPEPPDGTAIWEALVRIYGGLFPPADVPPALQGPGWQPPPGDPGPLREVAAQALGEEPPATADPEYDALKAAYHEAVTSGAHRVTALEPDPAADAHAVIQAVTRQQLHDAIRTLARIDPSWWDSELRRMARREGRTSLLGGHR